MSERNDIIDFLQRNIYKVKENFPFINSGGCGVFARILYNELTELNLKPEIYGCIKNADEVSPEQNEEINKAFSIYELSERKSIDCVHFIIKLNDRYIDARGVFLEAKNMLDVKFALTPIQPKTLVRFLENKGFSPQYSREDDAEVQSLVRRLFMIDYPIFQAQTFRAV